jgi:phospholipase/carboxylesterase
MDLVTTLRTDAPPGARLVLGGFSQGAMLACDVGLRLEPAPAALVLFSGSLINAPEWRQLAPRRRGLPVFQSHGREDPILPYGDAERARELLEEAGLEVEFLPFPGGHGIHPLALARAAALVARACPA